MSDTAPQFLPGRDGRTHIVIAGAGNVGCFVGGLLAAADHHVTLLARDRIIDEIEANGLTLSDFSGFLRQIPASHLTLSTSPQCLETASKILVTVKTGATIDIANLINRHAPASNPVISLQNGLEASAILRASLPRRDIRAAMVPFNVVPQGPGHYHRASSGDIVLEDGPGDLASLLSVPGLRVSETPDIAAFQWGKLLINLNNALNALSGLTLSDMLMSRDWRCLMADQMTEALAVLRTAGIAAKSTTPLPAKLIPHVLRLPTPVFIRIAAQMLTIDPSARTSMAYDLMAGRKTEIDSLQGAIITLGREKGVATPICEHVVDLIRAVSVGGDGVPHLSAAAVRP